ncbi:tripartite tricarboxylate transporter permease [Alkalibacter saccharofermentans]|uniref:Putative tricarboxylic transport membrane protein n=1 Tax=Alkalibacter saccharofermentans DSM 14828 TaxID=1120975 RepID=A0A1M4WG13_9FIRM|nr:tripartite tricarboxylate transporter permease [Alkalibacter saccharofermentans]SHE80154.1 putative tricarboxylic transport membrane protein [Alkalibacter saccharofermentans DSM 14828]
MITIGILILLGVVGGIIFGAIPGMTATMALAVFLPLTYAFDLTESLALLIGLYVGGISGGLVPAILLNIPGTPSSITTTFDGYPMTLKNQGERALKIGIASSLVGGLISWLILWFFAPTLASFALDFTPVEKFLLIVFALTVIISLSKGGLIVGTFSGVLGIFISLMGRHSSALGGNNQFRLVPEFLKDTLDSGFTLLPVLIGLFALGQIIEQCEIGMDSDCNTNVMSFTEKQEKKFSFRDLKDQKFNLIRSSVIGTFIGILPGVGGSAASILSYSQAKNMSKKPEELGKGAVEGVVASEASNNGLTGGALIPLLSLGIPGDSTTAILIGAFTLQGIAVGPTFINNNPETWNSLIWSLLVANILMFLVMFFAIKYIAKIICVPKQIIYPIIVVMCAVGAYAIRYGVMFDIWTVMFFGFVGYMFSKLGLKSAPFLIGFILGKELEQNLLQSIFYYDSWSIFFTKGPIVWVLWAFIAISLMVAIKENIDHWKQSKKA